jgi:uncharacterized protein
MQLTHQSSMAATVSSEPLVSGDIRSMESFRPSPRTLAAAAMFGLDVKDLCAEIPDDRIEVRLEEGTVLLITGPSGGGGKTTLLRRVIAQARREGRRMIEPSRLRRPQDRPLVDLFGGPLEEVVPILARAGLGEARLLGLRPSQLSDGQRFRLTLARVMNLADRSGQSCVIAVDEFASTLDETTARGVCRSVARWVRQSGHTLVAAGAASVLTDALQPEVLIVKPLDSPAEVVC